MMAPWGLPAQKKWFTQATPVRRRRADRACRGAANPMTLERFLAETERRLSSSKRR